MIELDSAIGNTLDHLFNLMASQARKAGFWDGGLSCRRPPSRLLGLKLLL